MDTFKFSHDQFKARGEILTDVHADNVSKCVEYIATRYEKRELLLDAIYFGSHDLVDSPKGDVESMAKLGFFPWVEALKELDQSLSLIYNCHYKNAFDSYRRAIELVVVGAFYVIPDSNAKKPREWISSERSTPNFKRACEALSKQEHFRGLNEQENWLEETLEFYWALSDILHVKGVKNSLNTVAPIYSWINGIGVPGFSEQSCKTALNFYIETTSQIATILGCSNPNLLQGLDLDVKFGFNPPASGFFYPAQAERLQNLVPKKYSTFFKFLLENDPGIQSIKDWFDSLPDISEEEIEEQIRAFGLSDEIK